MKKIRNLKKRKKNQKENYYENNNLQKTNEHTRLKNAHLLCIGAIFHRILTPTTHSCSPELVKTKLVKAKLVKTDFNQFNQAESSISRPTNN